MTLALAKSIRIKFVDEIYLQFIFVDEEKRQLKLDTWKSDTWNLTPVTSHLPTDMQHLTHT